MLKSIKKNVNLIFIVFVAFFVMCSATYVMVKRIMQVHLKTEIGELMTTTDVFVNAQFKEVKGILKNASLSIIDKVEIGQSAKDIQNYLIRYSVWLQENNVTSGAYSTSSNLYGFVNGAYEGAVWVPPKDYVPTERPWYKAALNLNGEIAMTEPYWDAMTSGLVLSYSNELFNKNKESIGVMAIDIRFNSIADRIKSIGITDDSYGMLLDTNLSVMVHPDLSFIGKKIQNKFPNIERYIKDSSKAENKFASFDIINENGENSIIFIRKTVNNWYLCVVIPHDTFYSDLNNILAFLITFSAISAVLLSYMLIKLNKEKNKADEENKNKSFFLANMSHEIRTPLNSIIGMANIELEKQKLSYDSQHSVEQIYNSGKYLLGLVNDILDMSKIRSGKFEILPEKYDFVQMLYDTTTNNRVHIGAKALNFVIEIDENIPNELIGDSFRIKQILYNLLSNAVKFTEKGSVQLKVSVASGSGISEIMLNFAVCDTGIGIKSENIPFLFDSFTQFGVSKNRMSGTGLGLAISKSLAEMMGGRITVKSKFNVGSEFILSIPQKIPSSAKPIGAETARSLENFKYANCDYRSFTRVMMPNVKVLAVDDMESNLEVAKGLLALYEIDSECVLSGKEAVKKIAEGDKFDLIFMDQMMPEMDGTETVRAIRNLNGEYAKSVPIIALTANALADVEKTFLENGFDDFLTKPIDAKALDKILKKYLGEKIAANSPESKNSREISQFIQSLPIIEGFKPRVALDRLGSEEIYRQSLLSFLNHIPKVLDSLNTENPNYEVIVHGIKSNLYGVGVMELGDLAKRLEFAAKEGDSIFIKEHTANFVSRVKNFILLLECTRTKDFSAKETLPAPNLELLKKIRFDCEYFNTEELFEHIKELNRYSYESGEDLVSWLSEKAENLDYEEIAERLGKELGIFQVAPPKPEAT